jgi:hypothetical protein
LLLPLGFHGPSDGDRYPGGDRWLCVRRIASSRQPVAPVMRGLRTTALAVVAAAVFAAGAAAFSVILEPLPTAFTGQAYSHQFRVRGGNPPYTFTANPEALPPGLSMSADGLLTGTPAKPGTWQFYVEASYIYKPNPPKYSQRRFTLEVQVGLAIRDSALPAAMRGVRYDRRLSASGGGKQAWSVSGGRLPSGLSLAPNGALTGSPTRAGEFTFTVKVADGTRVARRVFLLTVTEPLRVTAPSVPPAVVGAPFTTTVRVAGGLGPYRWAVRGVRPRGVALSRDGTLAGKPEIAGRHSFRVSVTDSLGHTRAIPLTIVVRPRLKIPIQALRPAQAGRPYRARILTRGGAAPLTFEIARGRLPAGVDLSPTTGMLSGEARVPGTYPLVIAVADRVGSKHSRSLVLTVR